MDSLLSHSLNETLGIDTSQLYLGVSALPDVDYIRVALYFGGILLFLCAGILVRNVVFYYTSGCSVGLLASVLLIAIIVYRMAPKTMIGIPILIGGWSFSASLLHYTWSNFTSIIQQYQEYVIGYFTLALLISFAVCYKRGPPTDERTFDIAQWSLQLVALVVIYVSTQVTRVSYATIAVLVLHQVTKSWLWRFLGTVLSMFSWIWYKIFPSTRCLTGEKCEQKTEEAVSTEVVEVDRVRG